MCFGVSMNTAMETTKLEPFLQMHQLYHVFQEDQANPKNKKYR